jgi:hopene-associated glycosyltransferase HpnB
MHIATLILASLGSVSLLTWVYLVLGRGMFWRTEPRLDACSQPASDDDTTWPSVSAVVPARNEVDLLPVTLPTLLKQDYPGGFHVYLVDDRSTDGTSEAAMRVAQECGTADRLTVVQGTDLPEGWKGKVWAMQQGVRHSEEGRSEYVLLADADVAHEPGVLRALVDKARARKLDLVSLMTVLRVKSLWDRLLVPAFVYFFAKLYPFRWVSDPHKRVAGANGGCILLRREALEKAGGFEVMADAIIDDCTMGALIKRNGGRTWLGFTRDARSLRPHESLSTTWNMVARYAFAQLNYSPLLLLGTVLSMLLAYLVPPVGTAFGAVVLGTTGHPVAGLWLVLASLAAWMLMAGSYLPMLRLYGLSPLLVPLLPVSAFLYTLMTISSGLRYWRGQGSVWKGRTYEATRSG